MLVFPFLLAACDTSSISKDPMDGDLLDRAYVVSDTSDDLFVFDHHTLAPVATLDSNVVPGTVNGNHMAMVRPDGEKVYVSAANVGVLAVYDAATLTRTGTIQIGSHATHMAVREGTDELWVMAEGDDSVVVIDMDTDTVTHRITDPSFHTPHFARFSGAYAYVPSIGGNGVSVVDLATYAVVDVLVPDGLVDGACDGDPCGFADAQIDPNGVLFASHFSSGAVLVYDTVARRRLPDVAVGLQSWSAFVDPFADEGPSALVPSWFTSTVTRVGATGDAAVWSAGDSEVYGVNYSPVAPDEAFVLDRAHETVTVLDRVSGALVDTLDVGGTTETATTTLEGRLLLPVSSAGELVVIDTASHEELARFSDVGAHPWSVATAEGQNYCH